ncbi:E3 ubiquitin-protein ligase CHFR isoform X2 [Pantherophis guttatus]|uniref:E3 ubiquitin-protein ligase CHFR n=1 Tax=Pantherophis guttatus TaxID=94885 RepID=A0A6P9D6J0_PANGU|nr:E3 ubiquitin-protein ligase CHFR isoform X2 [Pantherophis guttatus]
MYFFPSLCRCEVQMEHMDLGGCIQPIGKPQPWGKLIRLGVEQAEPHVLLQKNEWTIGRKKGCDLSFPGNKLVSGYHCKITVDEKSGQVLLQDTSTNGTVINKQKVVKRQTCPLQTGDVIYVVYRKYDPENNVAYLYESLHPKKDGANDPGEAKLDGACHTTKDTSSTRESNDGTSTAFPPPASRTSYEEPQPSTSTSNLFEIVPTSPFESTSTEKTDPSVVGSQPRTLIFAPALLKLVPSGPETLLQLRQPVVNSETSGASLRDAEKTAMFQLSEREGKDSPYPVRKKIRRDGEASSALQVVTPEGHAMKPDPGDAKSATMKPDKMGESLSCIICQELLHDCVSLQPCMHTFCAACYSGWMERSSLCPTCRCPVERICKNHILNNLVEAYLIQHPDKCRNEEDIRSMDARNKITQDMLQPKVRRSFSDEEGSSEDLLDLSDVDSESSDISQPYVLCRQCPGYRRQTVPPLTFPEQEGKTEPGQVPGDSPSTSSNFPTVQEYVCPAQGSHIFCTCCFQPMPDRRADREQNQDVAPQQCTICLQSFCHLYWGCVRVSCLGCLAPFCELNLGDKCLDGVLNGNNYESDILKDYLQSRGLTWKDMLNESLLALQKGTFILPDYRITGETVLCYFCGLRTFRELAYQYRQIIPAADLPAAVTSRPDCYWGRNCRTQVKAHHAMKFNHICEQTRFKN